MGNRVQGVVKPKWTSIYEGSKWKICTRCKVEKPEPDFDKVKVTKKTRKDGLSSWCRLCCSEHCKEKRIPRRLWEIEYLKDPKHRAAQRVNHRKLGKTKSRRYYCLIRNSRARGLSVEITYDQWLEFVSDNICHYCAGELDPAGHGLDRKNNDIGYVFSNVVPCCWKCNTMKRQMSYIEFIEKFGVSLSNQWKD